LAVISSQKILEGPQKPVTGHFGRDIFVHKELMKFVDPVQVTSSQFGQTVLLL